MGRIEFQPQDAPPGMRPYSPTVQDAPRPVPRDAPPDRRGLSPGWYPSPDGSRTLSWWTGRQWSRTLPRRPLPRELVFPVTREGRTGPEGKRSLPLALGLCVAGGPLGTVYANWRFGIPAGVLTYLAVANSAEPFPLFTYAMLVPINAGLAAHLAARHNERIDNGVETHRRRLRLPHLRLPARVRCFSTLGMPGARLSLVPRRVRRRAGSTTETSPPDPEPAYLGMG